jgi:hypothetical protein
MECRKKTDVKLHVQIRQYLVQKENHLVNSEVKTVATTLDSILLYNLNQHISVGLSKKPSSGNVEYRKTPHWNVSVLCSWDLNPKHP